MLLSEHGKLKYLEEEMLVYKEGVGIWSAQSDYFRNLKTTYTYALIVKSLINNQNLIKILTNRITSFVDRFELEIKSEDLIYINTCKELEIEFFECFIINNRRIKLKTIHNISSYQLLKVVLTRVNKRLWS